MINDDSIPFEEELPIRSSKPTFITDRDAITRVILNGSYTSDVSHRLLSGYSDELACRLTDSVIQPLSNGYFSESFKNAIMDNIEQPQVNLETLECTYTTQVELEYRIKPVIKNDDLDRKKWHQYSADSRNDVERSIKEMLEGNRKEY